MIGLCRVRGKMKVHLQPFRDFGARGGGWSAGGCGRFTHGKGLVPVVLRLGESRAGLHVHSTSCPIPSSQ